MVKKKTPHTVEKHSAILKHPVVCVDVCLAAMAPAFLQVLAELPSEALQSIRGRPLNAASSWPPAAGRRLPPVYEGPEMEP